MKKIRKALVCVLALLAAAFPASCSADTKQEPVQTLKVGVAAYRKDDTFISTLCGYLESAAKKLEKQKKVKIALNFADGQSNQSLQNDQVERFLARDYSAVCVNLVDRTAAAYIIDKAKKAGVPVVFFNREPVEEDLHIWNGAYYVGADAVLSGRIQGQIVAEAYRRDPARVDRNRDGKIQYAMLEGEQGHQDSLLRTEYSIKYLTEAGIRVQKLASDTANWQRAQGTAKMTQWLREYGGRLEVVLCNNDDMALGAIDAIKSSGETPKKSPLVVGVDGTKPGLEAVRSGSMLGTALNDAKRQADAIMELTYAVGNGQKAPPSLHFQQGNSIYIPYQKITRENVAQFQQGG
mgnify:FL=1